MFNEILTLSSMRQPSLTPYDLVAGVPFGGLHIATACSLLSGKPMIYFHPPKVGQRAVVEGNYTGDQTVLVIDDLLATGGTAEATVAMLQEAGADIVGCAFVIELEDLNGRSRLDGVPVHALITY